MSLGTILLILLVIALLGGFSGIGGGRFYGMGYYGGGGLGRVERRDIGLEVAGRRRRRVDDDPNDLIVGEPRRGRRRGDCGNEQSRECHCGAQSKERTKHSIPFAGGRLRAFASVERERELRILP